MTRPAGDEDAQLGEDVAGEEAEGQIEDATSSWFLEFLEIVIVGACFGGVYEAGQTGQWWTAVFIGTVVVFTYLERKNRQRLDETVRQMQRPS